MSISGPLTTQPPHVRANTAASNTDGIAMITSRHVIVLMDSTSSGTAPSQVLRGGEQWVAVNTQNRGTARDAALGNGSARHAEETDDSKLRRID